MFFRRSSKILTFVECFFTGLANRRRTFSPFSWRAYAASTLPQVASPHRARTSGVDAASVCLKWPPACPAKKQNTRNGVFPCVAAFVREDAADGGNYFCAVSPCTINERKRPPPPALGRTPTLLFLSDVEGEAKDGVPRSQRLFRVHGEEGVVA